MAIGDAKKAARQTVLSGFKHHSYETVTMELNRFLKFGGETPDFSSCLYAYSDILAPTPFRAMQNELICIIAVVTRAAIDNGVDVEFSFALNDYYIFEVEQQKSSADLQALLNELLENYSELVRDNSTHLNKYSLPVARAIRYIHEHITQICRIGEISEYLGLHPGYMSALFKKEVGVAPTQYIRERKMEEAVFLLKHSDYTVAQIGDMLGYCNIAHFSNAFKRVLGKTPNSQRCEKKM